MALRLTITSEQGPSLGDTASIVIGVGGGSIGRAHDNDWILPDPQRFVSAHHARVHFRNGQYLLEDCSTNGVYINDAPEPVRRRGLVALHDGDVLRLGGYRITAAVDGTGPIPAVEASSVFPIAPIHPPDAAGARPQPAQALDVSELLVLEKASPRAPGCACPTPTGSCCRSRTRASGISTSARRSAQEPATSPDLRNVAPDPRNETPDPRREAAESRRDVSRPINLGLVESGTALEQFCRGAGLAADQLPQGAQARACCSSAACCCARHWSTSRT
ncbi:MAG: type VI secretion system-associated FHA domain protein TagH [Steroidobacteraceae bacterium]